MSHHLMTRTELDLALERRRADYPTRRGSLEALGAPSPAARGTGSRAKRAWNWLAAFRYIRSTDTTCMSAPAGEPSRFRAEAEPSGSADSGGRTHDDERC